MVLCSNQSVHVVVVKFSSCRWSVWPLDSPLSSRGQCSLSQDSILLASFKSEDRESPQWQPFTGTSDLKESISFLLSTGTATAITLCPLLLSFLFLKPPPSLLRVEDDHFFLYASLASGRKTYFVSNDELGDHAHQYPPGVLPLLKQCQRSCQVTMDTKTGLLKVHTTVLG